MLINIGKVASHLVPFFLFPSGEPQAVKGKRIVRSVEKADAHGPKRETHLSLSQTTAIYALFAVLDPENTGMIPEGTQNLVVDSATKEAVLLNELKAFMDEKQDINGDGEVSFGEFLETQRISTR